MTVNDILQKWQEAAEKAMGRGESPETLREEDLREVEGIIVRCGIKAGSTGNPRRVCMG